MKKKFLSIILATLVSLSFISCGQGKTPVSSDVNSPVVSEQKAQYPLTIHNFNYQNEIIPTVYEKTPERVVVTGSTSTEIMIALGLQDKIVAALDSEAEDKFMPADIKTEYDKLHRLSFKEIKNKEVAMSYNPDMIFGWQNDFNDNLLGDVEEWHKKGVNTFIQRNSAPEPYEILDNLYWDILEIGKIFDVEDKAEALVQDYKQRVHEIDLKVENAKLKEKQKVMFCENTSKGNIRIYGHGNIVTHMIDRLGAINPVSTGGVEFGPEDVIAANPDVIFVSFLTTQDPEEMVKKITENPALANVNAVKNNRVFSTVRAQIYGACGRTISGYETFAEKIHPDLFK